MHGHDQRTVTLSQFEQHRPLRLPADHYAANLASPLAALSYAASTFQCTPAALAQPGGVALGAQAGPATVRQLADDAGFSRFRQVTQTPVNVVLELRP